MADDRQFKEPKVKQLIKDWMKAHAAFSWAPVSNGMGVHGIPDIIGCVPVIVTEEMVGARIGVFVGAEAKGSHRRGEANGGCSPQQVIRLAEIAEASGIAIVVYSPEELRELELCILNLGQRRG